MVSCGATETWLCQVVDHDLTPGKGHRGQSVALRSEKRPLSKPIRSTGIRTEDPFYKFLFSFFLFFLLWVGRAHQPCKAVYLGEGKLLYQT